MYFKECVRLAERHPHLVSAFQQIDSRLGAMGTSPVIRSADLASFLGLDSNQVISVLDMLADQGVLSRVEMIECSHCEMAAPRTDYLRGLDEDDEYRCTSCDHTLSDGTVEIITTYQRGKKWLISKASDGPDANATRAPALPNTLNVVLDDDGWYSYGRLAEAFSVGEEALRKRLDRFRGQNFDGWKAVDDRRPRESRYLYQLRAVRAIVEGIHASSQRPAK